MSHHSDQGEKDEDNLRSKEYNCSVVLVPTLKCEALHQDYFQAGGVVKENVKGAGPDSHHVKAQPPSFTSLSSTQSSPQPQNSSEHFLSHDQCVSHDYLKSHDQVPQSPDCSADKEIKSTSLSELHRLSPLTLSPFTFSTSSADPPNCDDCCQNPGLTQSCHEYYNTQQTSPNDSQRSHDIIQTSLIGGSCSILQNSELISSTKLTTNIQQAKKRCIPKVGIRTIPLIKIKPELKSAVLGKEYGCKNTQFGSTKENVNSLENRDLCESKDTNKEDDTEFSKEVPIESDIVGEVIVHEPYSRESLQLVSEIPLHSVNDVRESIDAKKRELSTIEEENKAITESGSELSVHSVQNYEDNNVNNTNDLESADIKSKVEPKTPDFQGTPRLKEKLHKAGLLDDSETANTNDSLFVNKDEDSLNTVTDILEEEFCTQYSDTEVDNQSDEECENTKGNCSDDSDASEYDNVNDIPDLDFESDAINIERVKQSSSVSDDISDVDRLERRLKARTCLSLGRDSRPDYYSAADSLKNAALRNVHSESEGTLYYSFSSLDNVKLNESCGALSKSSRKLPLKWTPRVLLESRISSLTSGTFSEASFHTADTFGTFYSARSFQLDSCDNFQTCEDFQQYTDNNQETKSKFSKAKEAIIRGRDFVKAKLDDYRKRIPNLRRINLREHSACQRSCGFSCVHVGKEISQYSLPETFGIKGNNSEKGDNSEEFEENHCEGNCCGPGDRNNESFESDMRMGKDLGLKDKRDQRTKTEDQKKGPKLSEDSKNSGKEGDNVSQRNRPNGVERKGTVKMDMLAKAREVNEDDLPVGSEALCIPRSKKQSDNGDSDGKPVSKRLRWVSAVEKTQGTSISSSFASNSRFKMRNLVEQLLTQRQTDPESMLRSLGFDGGSTTDESANRIPDRFLLNPCAAKGIDIFQFVLTHPELQHLVPACERTQQIQQGTGLDEVDYTADNSVSPAKGSMQTHHFSSVLQGVRFLQNTQSLGNFPSPTPPITHPTHHVSDDEMKQISSIPSVLDFPNRRFLAKQGFYGKEFASVLKKPKVDEQPSRSQQKPISAEQRRKQFHHAGRSKNWSLTEDSETDDSEKTDLSDPNQDSFDKGLILRSFSERLSSESSLESSDSFGDRKDELRRQDSINYLRKQYQATIRNSVDRSDGELPVFDSELGSLGIEPDEDEEKVTKKKLIKQQSISEIRKVQVDRLMSAEEDDGDYFAHSLKSSFREPLLRKLAHHSTQSTLTGSPVTPKEFTYSFENSLQDGDGEFDFPSSDENDYSNGKLKGQSSAVSIIIEDDTGNEQQFIPESTVTLQSNPNVLAPFHTIKRTDSSNTIVQADNYSDLEHSEGDVTPRGGDISPGLLLLSPGFDKKLINEDALSESTSSCETLATVLPGDHDAETEDSKLSKDIDEMECESLRSNGMLEVKAQQSANGNKDFLKPSIPRPQESFELEEISSADNAFEDINGNTTTKSQMKLGHFEKSLSMHSDSSGFADVDQVADLSLLADSSGEIIMGSPDPHKGARQPLIKQKTLDGFTGHDLSCYHDNQKTIPSLSPLLQTENREQNILGPSQATVNQANLETFVNKNQSRSLQKLHICGKKSSVDDIENENPSLQSISYIPNDQSQRDKSVVYSISVPMATNIPNLEPTGKVRYVSSVKFEVDSESSVDNESVRSLKITQAGPVLHQKILTDLDLGEGHQNKSEVSCDMDLKLNLDFLKDKDSEVKDDDQYEEQYMGQGIEMLPSNKNSVNEVMHFKTENGVSTDSAKQRILNKKRSKEASIAAATHTADWLLNNARQVQFDNKKQDFAHSLSQTRTGKPMWASTPDLNTRLYEKERNVKTYQSKHAGKSLDIDDEFEDDSEDRFDLPSNQHTSFSKQTSLGESFSSVIIQPTSLQNSAKQSAPMQYDCGNHFYAQEMRHSFLPSPVHKSVPMDNCSYIGSSTGMPEEQARYMKLAKLVNGPSLIVGTHIKMPIVRFTPNFHMKDWTLLPKQKHLEEETRLMQHAVQRYKIELIAMETMLFNMRQVAEQHLNKEERMDIEELQHLWSEVRKEVNKMEELLSLRLTAVLNGNIDYNPLDAVEIVHAMIELLREQLYHQQICIERDSNIDNMEEHEQESRFGHSSNISSSSLEPWLSDLSQQVSDIKASVSESQVNQKAELKQSLSEMRDSILSEVREEATSTHNVKMLQLQVQAREQEIKRLKLELLQQNLQTGKTRRLQKLESDV